jgi:hypothetical protein
MESPWGDIPVFDAHVHFFSHRFFQQLAVQRRCSLEEIASILEWRMPPEQPEQLAAEWVEELVRHRVDRAVLIGSLPGEDASIEAAVRAYPKRFYGFFMVNPLASDSLPAVQKALAGGFLQGICLFPAMHRYSLHDDRVLAILEAASLHTGSVVFIHCGVLSVGVRAKLGLHSPFDMSHSNPLDVHHLALRFPTLSFVIPHFGAGLFREALMVCDLCPNVYLDTSSSNSWIKFQEPGCDLRRIFERSLDIAGPRRLLFGTDSSFFPRGWHRAVFDQQAAVLSEIGITADQARQIFGENLQQVLSRGRTP